MTLLVGSSDPYNVSSGTLNTTIPYHLEYLPAAAVACSPLCLSGTKAMDVNFLFPSKRLRDEILVWQYILYRLEGVNKYRYAILQARSQGGGCKMVRVVEYL